MATRLTPKELETVSDVMRVRQKIGMGERLTPEEQRISQIGDALEQRLGRPITRTPEELAGRVAPSSAGTARGDESMRSGMPATEAAAAAPEGMEVTPFATARMVPEIQNPVNPVYEMPAQEMPEALTRREMPIVSGVTMRRVSPGAGTYGARGDLVPQNVERWTPMTPKEGVDKGFLQLAPDPNAAQRQAYQTERFQTALGRTNRMAQQAAGMRTANEDDMQAEMAATRGARWGSGGSTTQRNNRAQAIVDRIAARREQQAASDARIREERMTPKMAASGGVAMYADPATGQVTSAGAYDAKTAPKQMTPTQVANILKQAQMMRTPSAANSFKGDEEGAAMLENLLRQNGYDVDALRSGGAPDSAPAAGGKQTQKPAQKQYKAGDEKTINGVVYVRDANGKWNPKQ